MRRFNLHLGIDTFDIIYSLKERFTSFWYTWVKKVYIPPNKKWINWEERIDDLKIGDRITESGTVPKIEFGKPLLFLYENQTKISVDSLPFKISIGGKNLEILGITKDLKLHIKIGDASGYMEHGESLFLNGGNGSELYYLWNPMLLEVAAILILSQNDWVIIGSKSCGDYDPDIIVPNTMCFSVNRKGGLWIWNKDLSIMQEYPQNIIKSFKDENLNKDENLKAYFSQFKEIRHHQDIIVLELRDSLPLSEVLKNEDTQKLILKRFSGSWILSGENQVFHNEKFGFVLYFNQEFKKIIEKISLFLKS